MTTTQLATVDFHGTPLTVITTSDGERLVAIRPICEAIGLNWSGQYLRLQRDDVLSEGVCVMQTPSSGGDQQTVCLPLDYLNGWLFGIDTNRCREAIRPRLIEYKRECYRALAAYWMDGEARNPRRDRRSGSREAAVWLTETEAFNLAGLLGMLPYFKDVQQKAEKVLRAAESPLASTMFDAWHEPDFFCGSLKSVRERCKKVQARLSAPMLR